MKINDELFKLLKKLIMIFLPINMFLLGCEIFGEFYSNLTHAITAKYLYFGIEEKTMLVPFIWSMIVMNVWGLFLIYN